MFINRAFNISFSNYTSAHTQKAILTVNEAHIVSYSQCKYSTQCKNVSILVEKNENAFLKKFKHTNVHTQIAW